MTWASAYLACFALGLTFVGLSLLAGQFGGDAHGHVGGHAGGHDVGHGAGHGVGHGAGHGVGHDAGAHADSHDFPLPLLSPTLLALFIGMFGAGGLALLRGAGLTSPVLHVPGALAISATSGLSVAWLMMKLMRHAESNSRARHEDLIGCEAEVTLAIRGTEPGEIAYVAGGVRHTLTAHGDGTTHHAQGATVRVLTITDGIAQVGTAPSPLMESGFDPARPPVLGTPVRNKR